jgi:hypothetical protein
MRIQSGAPQPGPMIFANASARSGITFQRLTITGNRFENKATASIGYAIDLRRVQNSIIADNHVAGATSGIAWITSNLEAIGCDCAMREPTPFAHRRL